ncbi:MAG: hypothetical protein EBS92_05270, partial [Proteobacteria bacterium]|nr:hypothetical protein [Pseudomonadota bacterium]
AAERGHLEIVKALIEAGANIDLVNKFGLNAIERARKINATKK